MATPPSPDTIMLFKLLEDPEKWYGYYDIKNKIAEKVAPGRALRKYKQRLKESRDLRGTVGVEIERTQGEMIRLGAMACAQVALTSWKGKGIMIRGEGQYKEIRIKPGFQSWGLVTAPETGEEASGGEQEPGKDAEGYTEVPPEHSEPSEGPRQAPESVPEPVAEPQPAVVETGTVEVVPDEPADIPTFTVEEVFGEQPAQPEPEPVAEPVAVTVAGEEPQGDLGPAADTASRWVTLNEVETCPDCGMGMTDKAIHEDWHEQLRRVTATSGSAFVDPETLRTLVEGVMRQALTRFQANMQDWLETQFAELERQIRLGGKVEKVRRPWAEESPY